MREGRLVQGSVVESGRDRGGGCRKKRLCDFWQGCPRKPHCQLPTNARPTKGIGSRRRGVVSARNKQQGKRGGLASSRAQVLVRYVNDTPRGCWQPPGEAACAPVSTLREDVCAAPKTKAVCAAFSNLDEGCRAQRGEAGLSVVNRDEGRTL